MAALLPRILRIPTAGDDFVLVEVSSAGRSIHDLKLIGTDGAEVYSTKIKHSQSSTLTSKNFAGTQAQWEETLSVTLLGGAGTEFTQGVEAVSKVRPETDITIVIQKSIEGIKQRYGTITLAHTPEEEVSPFDWCALAVQSQTTLNTQLAQVNARLKEKDDEVKKLRDALTELESVKAAYEEDLFEKFAELLNEKKLKVRNQGRLLKSTNVDSGKLEEVERNRVPKRDSSPGPSRRGKRKAAIKDESDEDEDDGFEKMDVDAKPEAAVPNRNSADEEDRRTEDEESTADEDSDPEVQLPVRNMSTAKPADAEVPPPKRELPFSKKAAAPPAAAPRPLVEGSETEDDDDEL